MLIQFKAKNFLSFKHEVILNTVASNITEFQKSNVFVNHKEKYLKSIAIYGANASGKSNLFKAIGFFKHFVKNSYKLSLDDSITPVTPFKLSTETENKPSSFEITFIHKQVQYRYGFTVDRIRIHQEWLYSLELKPRSKENLLFQRGKKIKLGRTIKKWNIKQIDEATIRSNVLVLTKLAMDYDKIQEEVLNWFNNLNTISGYKPSSYSSYTRKKIDSNPDFKKQVINLLRAADIQISDIFVQKTHLEPDKIPEKLKTKLMNLSQQIPGRIEDVEQLDYLTRHNKYNLRNKLVGSTLLSLDEEESQGTNQLFNLLGPIIDTISHNKILFIDEIDSSLHPYLTQLLVKLFNSTNNEMSQLIFTTHDVALLNAHCLRRDQVWFTELDEYGASQLFSLANFKESETGQKVRKDADYLKQYMLGRYGAIPLVDEIHEED